MSLSYFANICSCYDLNRAHCEAVEEFSPKEDLIRRCNEFHGHGSERDDQGSDQCVASTDPVCDLSREESADDLPGILLVCAPSSNSHS